MKLEKGMYIKTKYGSIGKITKFEEAYDFTAFKNGLKKPIKRPIAIVDTHYSYVDEYDDYLIEDIVKASHNIIDLIEDDDFIEYRRYGELCFDIAYSLPCFDKYKMFVNCNGEVLDLEDLDIVSILTKEQFESMVYKL